MKIYGTLCVVMLLVCGCSTPEPVLKLTEKTAANVTTVQGNLDKYAKSRSEVYQESVKRDAAFMKHLAEVRDGLSGYEDAMELSGEKAKAKAYKGVIAASDKALTRRNLMEAQVAKRRQEALDSYTELEVSSDKMKALAKMLDKLARELSPEDQLKFYSEFAASAYDKYGKLQNPETTPPTP